MFGLVLQATISSTWSELRRTVSTQKLIIGLVLALFPPFIMYMIFSMDGQQVPPELVMAILLWMVGLLSLILWLPPGVYSELEGQTWILSTSRPYGRVSLMLGKYLSAVVWTMTVLVLSYVVTTLICLTLPENSLRLDNGERSQFSPAATRAEMPTRAEIESLLANPSQDRVDELNQKYMDARRQTEDSPLDDPLEEEDKKYINLAQYSLGFLQVCFLAALAYGSVFSLLSVLALKRAMGFAVGYVIVSEVLLASVPAMVQKFTVRYHLQSLGLNCISDFGLSELEDGGMVTNLVLNEPLPLWGNYLCLSLGALAIMSATIIFANWRQLITVHET